MLLKVLAELFVHQRLDEALHLAVTELGFRLAFELRFLHLYAHYGGEALADILALQRLGVLLQQTVGGGVLVDRPRQRGLEPDEVRTAFDGVDVVGEAVDVFSVALVPLQGDFDLEVLLLALEIYHLGMDRGFGPAQVLDELRDTTAVAEGVLLLRALVVDADAHAAVEEGQFAQPLRQDVEAEVELLEDERVRLEGHLRAALPRGADLFQRALRLAAVIALHVDLAVALDLDLERFGQRVHDRHADTMQTAGDLVRMAVEFPASVEFRHDDFRGRYTFGGVNLDGNAATVVFNCDRAIDVDGDVDLVAAADQRLVDRIVDHLEDEVVQAALGGVADVHTGTLSNRIQAL